MVQHTPALFHSCLRTLWISLADCLARRFVPEATVAEDIQLFGSWIAKGLGLGLGLRFTSAKASETSVRKAEALSGGSGEGLRGRDVLRGLRELGL